MKHLSCLNWTVVGSPVGSKNYTSIMIYVPLTGYSGDVGLADWVTREMPYKVRAITEISVWRGLHTGP